MAKKTSKATTKTAAKKVTAKRVPVKKAASKKAAPKKAARKVAKKAAAKAAPAPDNMPAVGKAAPAFTLPAVPDTPPAKAGKVRLSQFKGEQNVVLYFYPRDLTPGCTTEACDFRDATQRLASADTVVLGVSTDDATSHEKFIAKHDLSFLLLVDADHSVCEKYGVWVEKNMYGKKSMGVQRATFLINKSGKVARVWPKVKVKGHVDDVLAAIDTLEP